MRSCYWEINCDTCENEYVGPEPTSRAVVRVARLQGWLLAPASQGGDLCPDCKRIADEYASMAVAE